MVHFSCRRKNIVFRLRYMQKLTEEDVNPTRGVHKRILHVKRLLMNVRKIVTISKLPFKLQHTRPLVNFYRPQTKLRKGYVLTSVCQEFCPWGRGVSQHALGQTPPQQVHTQQVHPHGKVHPRAGTPPWQVHPPLAGTPPPGRYLPGRYTPRRYTCPLAGTPPWAGTLLWAGKPPTTVTAADGTHPTRILSCFKIFFVPVLHMVTQTLSCIFLKDTQISNFPTAYSMPDNFMEQNILSINKNNRHTVFVRFCYS